MWIRAAFAAALAAVSFSSGASAQGAKDGETLFKHVCFVCHAAEAGVNKLGPSLFGVIGRRAGTAPGFKYSDAMEKSGIVWDEAAVETYLRDPKAAVPGNKMAYAGVKKPEDRKEILAYLTTLH
jgi:cytochrome c